MVRSPSNPGSAREAWSDPTARIDWLEGNVALEDGHGTEAVDFWLRPPVKRRGPLYGRFQVCHEDIHGSQVAHAMEKHVDGSFTGEVDRTRLVLKGTGLTNLRSEGVSDFHALHAFRRWQNRCARIDLAIDVLHPDVTPKKFHDLHQQRRMVTRLKVPKLMGDKDAGQTFYLEGRNQLIRVYDKSAERKRKGSTDLPPGITRLELELKGPWARRAFNDLTTIPPDDWDERFPELVGGLFLSKCRPLNGPRPERNPQRAPLWTPLAEAMDGIKPVRLSTEELKRGVTARIAAKFDHLANQLPFLAFMEEVLGTGPFLQAVRHAKLSGANAYLATFLQENPDALDAMWKRLGLPDRQEEQHP